MNNFSHCKQEVLELIDSVIAFAEKCENTVWTTSLEEAKQGLESEKIYVVICGEFKQGKSSLINALLDEVHLFPVDVDITTNLITTISYGEVEKIEVTLQESQDSSLKEISRSEISDYVTEQKNSGNHKKAKLLNVTSPNPKLKSGIVLVDTPGIGSLNREHTNLTSSFLSFADVIIFVSDIYTPLKSREIIFLKEYVIPKCQSIIFVITKIDSGGDVKMVVESNREKLVTTLENLEDDVSIIPVSSLAKLDYLEYGDSQDLEFSQFPLLEKEIWSFSEKNRRKLLLLKPLDSLEQALMYIKMPLEIKAQAYTKQTQDNWNTWHQQQSQELIKLKRQFEELLQSHTEWKIELEKEIKKINNSINQEFFNQFKGIEYQAKKLLKNEENVNHLEKTIFDIESMLENLIISLSKEINWKANELCDVLQQKTKLKFNFSSPKPAKYKAVEFDFEAIKPEINNTAEKVIKFGRTGTLVSGAGGFLGGVIGGILGGVGGFFGGLGAGIVPGAMTGIQVGSTLGSLFGATKGIIDGINQISDDEIKKKRMVIEEYLEKYLKHNEEQLKYTLGSIISDRSDFIESELIRNIKQQQFTANKTFEILANANFQENQLHLEQAKDIQEKLDWIKQREIKIQKLIKSLSKKLQK